MILHVLANPGQLGDNVDTESLEVLTVTDARQLQQLG